MNYYKNKVMIPEEVEENFKKLKKEKVNEVERIGLTNILRDFLKEINHSFYSQYIRAIEDGLDILDGYHNSFIFDDYAFNKIWMTTEGAVIIEAYDLSEINNNDREIDVKVFNKYDVRKEPLTLFRIL